MTLRQRFNDLVISLATGTVEDRTHKLMRWVAEITTLEEIPQDVFADAPQEVLQILLFTFTTELFRALQEESHYVSRRDLGDRPDPDNAPAALPEV